MSALEDNACRLAEIAVDRFAAGGGRRILIGIAGPAGSGKSTLAERAVEIVNQASLEKAAVFPMDGFHFDDAVLKTLGRLPNKGAIDTFDVHGLRHMLLRLKSNEDDVVAVPVFDRTIEIARAGGRLISSNTGIIICEGNYLLMRQPPWDTLKSVFDVTVFVDVGEDELRRRLRARWTNYGLDEDVVDRKVNENDLPNGLAIIAGSREPDLRLSNE